jgi:hypothetical protein
MNHEDASRQVMLASRAARAGAGASGANVALWLRSMREARPGVIKPANFRSFRGLGAHRLKDARPNICKT